MTDHKEKATELFYQGCNCSQAVFAAFCDITGIGYEEALKMASPFGGGLGRLRETCGAVSGMALAAGCLYGYNDITDPEKKKEVYALTAGMAVKFKAEMGSIICKELLGLENYEYSPEAQPRTPEFYQTRPCPKCIATAAGILDDVIRAKEAK